MDSQRENLNFGKNTKNWQGIISKSSEILK